MLTPLPKPDTVRVALAGNPNCGKTTLFNALTGAQQHVGNYPGVTVEKRTGRASLGGVRADVQDLPGTYSLSSFSPEERIAQDALLDGQFDVVVVVVDSTTLHRSLVLLAQVMLTGANPVLCLNMADEARAAGQQLDIPLMRTLLGIPVVETVGHRSEGVDALREAILTASRHPGERDRLVLGERIDDALDIISAAIAEAGLPREHQRWMAARLLLADEAVIQRAQALGPIGQVAIDEAQRLRQRLEAESRDDIGMLFTQATFGFVDGLLREVTIHEPSIDTRVLSDAIDRILVHKVLGLPIFAAIMYAIFWITFTLGQPPMDWIQSGFDWLTAQLNAMWPAASPLRSLLVDGVIGGVGGVLVFIPNIVLLFGGLALLEDTGYMSRIAFLMDRVMHRFGLHGKSFVPMMLGFGCSIPGIMATRTLENERDRLTTMLVLPLMSCSARLIIWLLLIPAFFSPAWRAPMLFFIYAFGVGLAFGLALLLRKTLLHGEEAPFVMELPPYRMPTLRAVLTRMGENAWLYMRKAGTVILGITIVLWAMTAYPKKSSYDVDAAVAAGQVQLTEQQIEQAHVSEDLRYSMAGTIGRFMEPAIKPLGFDWRMGTAMIGAFAAKEVFVSQMGIVFSMGEGEDHEGLQDTLAREYSPLVGVSLMIFLLVSAPCMATIAVTRRESGSWKWAMLQLVGLTAIAWVLSFVVYQVGSLFP